MDQGVIRSLKSKYRIRVIQKIITAIDQGKQVTQTSQISILEAMKMLVLSWSEVTATTIANCFSKAGFSQNVSSEEDDPFSKLRESLDQLQQHDEDFVPEDFRYDDLLTVDDDVAVMGGVMTEEEILQEIRENETVEEEEEEETEMMKMKSQ